jgi:hypothetical protein
MNSLGDLTVFIVILLYPYLLAPALVLLNWRLTRLLATRLVRARLVVTNLAISLLLLGPIGDHGGNFVLMGDSYYPWYLGGFSLDLDKVWWMGLLMLCAVSVVTTVATLSHPRSRLARGNQGDRMPP